MVETMHEQKEESTATKLVRLHRLCGPPPVLSSEDPKSYEELLISLLACYRPRKVMAEMLIRHLANEEWEINRLTRHKTLLMERRFRARLAFQAYREKAAQEGHEGKEALAKKVAERRSGPFTLPEEALEDVIADVDAALLRPAQELEHARALEVGIEYYEHLDRLLNAAFVRRTAILNLIERHDEGFHPSRTLPVVVEKVDEASNGHGSQTQGSEGQPNEVAAPPLVPSQDGQS
jgi:hypothetical protein